MKNSSIFLRTLIAVCLAMSYVPSPASAQEPPPPLLIVGDSVFNAFDYVPSAKQLLNRHQRTIFAVQGCQKLLEDGCMSFAKLSALEQLRKHAGRFTDVVVIGTGYNDRLGIPFREAVFAITSEAATQGVDVVWVTYRERGNVRGKSKTMNIQLRKLAEKIPNLTIADWNSYSDDSVNKNKSWFREDNVHLITLGALGLARLINQTVDQVIAKRALAELG
ncbi:MAG: hypothetical protein HQ486_07290 [Acidimicrobiaceae bacterium]|nr:hypothetical protein [Acidimicrobiaceae bacterium]